MAKIKAQGQFVTPTLIILQYGHRHLVLRQFLDIQPWRNRMLAHAEANARNLYKAEVPLLAGMDPIGTVVLNGTTKGGP
jgi:hypothetical protein